MKTNRHRPQLKLLIYRCLLIAGLSTPVASYPQSSCSSDGAARPAAILERFINADCKDCWADVQTPRVLAGELALDWIVPSPKGEEAPLSAVATRDATERLQALQLKAQPTRWSHLTRVENSSGSLRVAHGLAYGGYIGASIELSSAPKKRTGPWTAWLALVETVPRGTEGSPLARNLIRNVLQSNIAERKQLLKKEQMFFSEARSMQVPEGANPKHLRVVGWIEDSQGRVLNAAQSRCKPTP